MKHQSLQLVYELFTAVMRAIDSKLFSELWNKNAEVTEGRAVWKYLGEKMMTVVSYGGLKGNQLCFCFVASLVGWHF